MKESKIIFLLLFKFLLLFWVVKYLRLINSLIYILYITHIFLDDTTRNINPLSQQRWKNPFSIIRSLLRNSRNCRCCRSVLRIIIEKKIRLLKYIYSRLVLGALYINHKILPLFYLQLNYR